jgi:acyl carrier protein
MVDRTAVLTRLQRLASGRVPVDPALLTPEARLADIGIDSFSLIELVFLAEEEFDIKIPIDKLQVTTVGDVIDVIEQNMRGTSLDGAHD